MGYLQTNVILIYILFLFTIQTLVAQQPAFQIITSIKVNADKFTTDVFGNFYVLEGNNIKKYNADGILLNSYSSPFLGKPSFADATNSMRMMVFYSAFNKIQWLDKNMTELGAAIDLNDLLQEQAAWVCSSSKGGFWAITESTGKMLYYTDKLLLKISQPFNEPCFLNGKKVAGMIEKNERLFILCPDRLLFCFDLFGNKLKQFFVDNINDFQVENRIVRCYGRQTIKIINVDSGSDQIILVPVAGENSKMRIENQHIYILKPGMLEIYKMMFE